MSKDLEVKTYLTYGQWKAFQSQLQARGSTAAHYLRELILNDLIDGDERLSRLNDIVSRASSVLEPSQNELNLDGD